MVFSGWESMENYLSKKRDEIHLLDGFHGERLAFTRQGYPDWSDYRVGLNVSNHNAYAFGRYYLCLPSKPLDGIYWVNATQLKEYISFLKNHKRDYSLYLRLRRSRLGERWELNLFQLSPQELFILRMTDEEFRRHFDQNGRIPYSKIGERVHLGAPTLRSTPEGFPDSGPYSPSLPLKEDWGRM